MVEDAEGVSAEGGMGLAVLEWQLLSSFAALGPFPRCWWLGGVNVVEVSHWGWEVPVEGWGVEGVMAVGLVRGGSQDG